MNTPLISGFYAIAAAALFGLFCLLARKGQKYANATSGVIIGLVFAVPMMGVVTVFLWEPGWWNVKALAYFALAGILGPAAGRIFLFMAFHHLGISRTMPLTSMTPLIAAIVAYFFVGERPGDHISG